MKTEWNYQPLASENYEPSTHEWPTSYLVVKDETIETPEGPDTERTIVCQVEHENEAKLFAAAALMFETLTWIKSQQHLFFAECSQAEEIVERVGKTLMIAKYGRLKESPSPLPTTH